MSTTLGAFGIKRVEYSDTCLTCLECYRHWSDDITPAGRCPWEHLHQRDQRAHVALRKRKAVIAGIWG